MKKKINFFFGKNGWKICFSLRKKWRFFFRIFWFRFSISIVVGTKDVYVIRGIVSQGSKLSKILRTTKTTTKKAVFFWKIRNKPHQNQKKKKIFIPTINQQQKISHLWKKNTKKNSLPTKKKKLNATKKRNKNSFFLFAAV